MRYRLFFSIFFLFFALRSMGQSVASSVQEITEKAFELTFSDQCEEAISLLENTLSREKKLLLQGDLYYTLAVVHYMCGEGERVYQKVLAYHGKSLDIRKKELRKGHPKTIKSYYGLSVLHNDFGRFEQAIQAGLEAARLLEGASKKDLLTMSKVYHVLGITHEETGDLATALSFSKQALDLSLQLKEQDRAIACLNNIGLIHLTNQDYKKALSFFEKIDQTEGLAEEDRANCYNNMGLVYTKIKNWKRAIRYFHLSKNINARLYAAERYPEYRLNIAENLENLGNVYKHKGDYRQAKQAIMASLQILEEELQTQHHPDVGACYDNMGDIFFEQGSFEQAIAYYHRGVMSLVPDLQNTEPSVNPDFNKNWSFDKYTLLTLLHSKATSFYRLYQQNPENQQALQRAYQGYENLDQLLTQVRQFYREGDSKYALIEKSQYIYEQALEVALERYRLSGAEEFLERAFQYSAQNKAIVLLEGLQAEEAKYAHVAPHYLKEEQDIRQNCIKLETQIYDYQLQGFQHKSDSLKKILFQRRRSYHKLIRQLEEQHPEYYNLKYTFIQPPRVKNLQQKLPDNSLLLEYFIGDQVIYLFALSRQNFQYYAIPKPDNFDWLCAEFRNLSTQDRINDTEVYQAIAYRLYQVLLEEVLDKTSDQKISRLFIVPHENLHQLSFDNLFYKKTERWKNRNNPYLLKKYACSYAYSSRLFFDHSANARIEKATKGFAGFGLAYDDYTLESLSDWYQNTTKQKQQKRSMGQLIYAVEEIQAIAEILGGDLWTNQEATSEAFLHNAGDYQVLHLAMHALEIKDQPLHSALAFSRNLKSDDFLIRATELYALPLKADLVVLSACDTGSGPLDKGEGVRSLARAFSFAGCPSIIASLWSASDAASKEILIPFYQNLKKGWPKDIALQKAKLQYLETSPPSYISPSYWSNLVLVGTASPIDLRPSGKPYRFWMIASILALMAVVFLFYSTYKRRRDVKNL